LSCCTTGGGEECEVSLKPAVLSQGVFVGAVPYRTMSCCVVLCLCLQDFLTCAFLVTSRDKFLTRSQFSQLAAAMGDGLDEVRGGGER